MSFPKLPKLFCVRRNIFGGFLDQTIDRWQVGKNYFIRTVTHHLTGTLIAVTDKELWLRDAAWIADDGRFMQALRDGVFNEVEPFPDEEEIAVGRGSLIDAIIWYHPLPRIQK